MTTETRRSYDDGCAAAHALNLVGERWALLIVRELLLGPRRFTDLRVALPAISPNILTQRLAELTDAAVLTKRQLPFPVTIWVYELSPWGLELETTIKELGRWGARSPVLPRGRPMSVSSLILSMRTMFSAEAAAGVRLTLDLAIGTETFSVVVAKGAITIERGRARDPDARLVSDPDTLARLAYDGYRLGDAIEAGTAFVEGDRGVAKRFLKLFTLPVPAPAKDALA